MTKDILFIKPSTPTIIPVGRHRPISAPHFPSQSSQARRIGPKLQRLSDAFAKKLMVVQDNIQGASPEFVLVFETAGSVDNFIRAAQRAGMEWLFDLDSQIEPNEDFYSTKSDGSASTANVSTKLYLTMTNQTAMQQMLSLWKIYCSGNKVYPYGLTSFRDVFAQLSDIRKWDIRDRFQETGVIEKWKELW